MANHSLVVVFLLISAHPTSCQLPTLYSTFRGIVLCQFTVSQLLSMMKTTTELPLRILTHNIRYATKSPFKGELPWDDRKQPLLNELRFNTRNQDTFICLQEVLHNQLVDVLSGLNQESSSSSRSMPTNQQWDYIGVGRDDGHEAGEYSAIFYKPSIWQLKHWKSVWLSETPDKPSKSWDAASIRILVGYSYFTGLTFK